MSKLLTYGSVGGAPGNRCSYPEIQEEDVKTDNSETEESANPQSLTKGKHSGKGCGGG